MTQTEALTDAAKRIEASISHDLWSRQKQWEMKRDYLLSAIEPIGRMDGILIRLVAAMEKCSDPTTIDFDFFLKQRKEAVEEWSSAIGLFDERRRLLLLLCTRQTSDAFLVASREIRLVVQLLLKQTDSDIGLLGARV